MKLRTKRVGRYFGDLRVRPKLMVLHNVFFLVLGCAVYFSLIPLIEQRILQARARETSLITRLLAQGSAHPELGMYEYREGAADELNVPPEMRRELRANPSQVRLDPSDRSIAFRYDAERGLYRRVRLPAAFYDEVLQRARWTLFVVLGVIYALAVLLLELVIMPKYVYRPIRAIMEADEATRSGDRERELIEESDILDDEIGQIMRSRNASVAELRRHEEELESALAELTQKNQMLEAARRSMQEQDRLASLGLLSASVAHELNTPLAVLHGSIEKMIETTPGKAAQERLERMLRVTRRLRKISESLLDFARVRKRERTPVKLRGVVEESWGLVAIDEKASAAAFRNEVPEEAVVVGDQDRLVQVFVNLLRNALNAVAAGGQIRARAVACVETGEPCWRVYVEDDGPGIPEEILPNIFEAFVTTRLDARGTGLGLTVAEGIVTQHGGVISARNRAEGGASIEVTLPAAARVAAGGTLRGNPGA
jgi:two-component system NtrC family sensor kinase